MRGRLRTAGRIAGVVVLAVTLTGCIKLHENLFLTPDNTVNGSITLGVSKQLLQISGTSKDDFLQQITASDSPLPEGVQFETKEFEDDTFVGQTYEFTGVPLSSFATTGGELSIVREGDNFHVTGTLDLSGGDAGIDPNDPTTQQFLDTFDVQIAITFPGDVQSATGTIDGNTVTWTPKFGDKLEIDAVGSAADNGKGASGPGSGSSSLLWIVLGLVALAVIVLAVVLMSRRNKGAPVIAPADAPGFSSPSEADAVGGTVEAPSMPATPPTMPSPAPVEPPATSSDPLSSAPPTAAPPRPVEPPVPDDGSPADGDNA